MSCRLCQVFIDTIVFFPGDTEHAESAVSLYTPWSHQATLALINLYRKYEAEFENPLNKKKEIWRNITTELVKLGHKYSQNKVESKFRSMVRSHNAVRQNKKKTGAKRKTFQYYPQMEQLLAKRHDINPPFVSGSSVPEPSTSKPDTTPQKPSEKPVGERSITSSESEGDSSLVLSETKNAKRKRQKRARQSKNSSEESLQLLREMEEQRIEDNRQREVNRDRRAKARDDLMREFLNILKN